MSIGVLACSSTSSSTTTSSSTATSQSSADQLLPAIAHLTHLSSSSSIDWSALPTTEVTLSNDGLKITEGGTYILTGSTTAGITVETDANVPYHFSRCRDFKLRYLAAINVISADNVEWNFKMERQTL